MSAEAREAVARKLFDCYAEELGHADAEWDNESSMSQDDWRRDADAVLAALRPFIAAEIRAWAEGEIEVYEPDAEVGGRLDRARTLGRISQLWELVTDAPAIAARITTTGEQQ